MKVWSKNFVFKVGLFLGLCTFLMREGIAADDLMEGVVSAPPPFYFPKALRDITDAKLQQIRHDIDNFKRGAACNRDRLNYAWNLHQGIKRYGRDGNCDDILCQDIRQAEQLYRQVALPDESYREVAEIMLAIMAVEGKGTFAEMQKEKRYVYAWEIFSKHSQRNPFAKAYMLDMWENTPGLAEAEEREIDAQYQALINDMEAGHLAFVPLAYINWGKRYENGKLNYRYQEPGLTPFRRQLTQKYAVLYYQKASLTDARGKVNLAVLLEHADADIFPDMRIEPRLVQARALLEAAAFDGDPLGLTYLGDMYENGKGGELNLYTAENLYRASAQLKCLDGILRYASFLERKKELYSLYGLERHYREIPGGDKKAALKQYELAAEFGSEDAALSVIRLMGQ